MKGFFDAQMKGVTLMELFRLLGRIAIENSDANAAIDETTGQAERSESKIKTAFGKIGTAAVDAGKVIATGLAAGATAMGGLVTKALDVAGELEQNIGGSEAVFKEHAEGMQETAKDAFKNMGLSQTDFLATANKMGALFQGAGFEIEESAELSAKAMQRASDVASIMGIDISSAMEAVAGAAKGNFTMMDNLGVAMNETTLEAYAMEKGMDKAYSAMSNQEKIGLAMELFLEKTQYAAGNYAKENETLAGSLNTAKAALTNFLSGSGDVSDLADAMVNAADVIITKVQELLPGLVSGIQELITRLLPYLPGIIQTLLPGIIQGAVTLFTGLISALPMLIQIIIEQLPFIVTSLAQALRETFPVLVETVKELFGQIIAKVQEVLPGVSEAVSNVWNNHLKPALQEIGDFLNEKVKPAFEFVFETIIKPLVENVFGSIKRLWTETLKPVFNGIRDFLKGVFTNDWKTALQGLLNIATGIFNGIMNAIRTPMNTAKDIVSKAIDFIKKKFDFKWELPKLKLPHFSIKGEFSLNPPSIPSFGVEWYKKGAVLNDATIFGMNPSTGKAMVGGEAGAEAVAPIDVLQSYVSEAVAAQNAGLVEVVNEWMQKLMEFLMQYIPGISNMRVCLDSGVLVGAMAPGMDKQLGNIAKRKARES